jgi:hypothetical protein
MGRHGQATERNDQAAGRWWELPVQGDGRVHVTRPDRQAFRGRAKLRIHRTVLDPQVVTTRHGRRLTEQPGRWGNRQLSLMRRQAVPGAEAESERRVQRILRAGGIGGWRANMPITLDGQRFRLDLAFEAARVAAEVEGWAFHRSKERRDRDLAKLNALARNDWVLITFSWEHTEDPDYICRSVHTVLQQRSFRYGGEHPRHGDGGGFDVAAGPTAIGVEKCCPVTRPGS